MSKIKVPITVLCLWVLSGCSQYTEEQKAALVRGKEVYIANCLSCHGADGKGLGGEYPGLIRETITTDYTARAQYLIEKGSLSEGGMLPIPITAKEKIEVINYIQNSWNNKAEFLEVRSSTKLSTK